MSLFKSFALVVCLLVLGACGFQPLYGRNVAGNPSGQFSKIKILPILDRVGQQLHNRLSSVLNPHGAPGNPSFILKTRIVESTVSLAVRKSAFSTRANLIVTAFFELKPVRRRKKVFSGHSAITVSYNIFISDFATLSAEKDARNRAVREIAEDIRIQLGTHFSRAATSPKAPR